MNRRLFATTIALALSGPGLGAANSLTERVRTDPSAEERVNDQISLTLYPNLTSNDEDWRKLNRDVRYRRALSLAIDRDELNEILFNGFGQPRSVLFKPEHAARWAHHDPKLANELLDEIGLKQRNGNGIRRLPDGEPMNIVVEHAAEDVEVGSTLADLLTLIKDHWKKIGIQLRSKPQTLANLRLRALNGDATMTADAGMKMAVPTSDTRPWEFAPTTASALQWAAWGLFTESDGKQGERCDLPEACQLLGLLHDWDKAPDEAARRDIWGKILSIHADQVFSIGTVSGPVRRKPTLRR